MAGTDSVFADLMTGTAEVARPTVELDGDGGPKTPTYDMTGQSVRVRVTPARSTSEDDLLGRMKDTTHVIYAEPADIRMGDRLVTRPVTTVLTEDVVAGDSVLRVRSTTGMRDGQTVVIGGEEKTVLSVGAETLTVTPVMAGDRDEGEAVSVVVRYEVLGVEDAAGMGHHLRVTAAGSDGNDGLTP